MRLRLLPLAALLAASVSFGAPLHAQQAAAPAQGQAQAAPSPSHLAAAREFMKASGASASIDRVMPFLIEDIRRTQNSRPELKADLDTVIDSLKPELEQQIQKGYEIAARVYATGMSEAELKEGTAFFEGPVGKKYVRLLPLITENLVNDITLWSQQSAEYVMTRVRAEMAKKGHQLQ